MVTKWFSALWLIVVLIFAIASWFLIRCAESAELPPRRNNHLEAVDRKARPYWPWLGTRQYAGDAKPGARRAALSRIHGVLHSSMFPGQSSMRHVRLTGSGRHTYHIELDSGLKYGNGHRAFRIFFADDHERLFQMRGSFGDAVPSEFDIQFSLRPMDGETFDRSLLIKSRPNLHEEYFLTERFKYNAMPMRSIEHQEKELLERHEFIELARNARPPFQASRRNPVVMGLSHLISAESLDLGVDSLNGTLQVLFYGEKYPLEMK